MTTDDLSAPLGQEKKRRSLRLPVSLPAATAGLLGLILAGFFGWAALVNDPVGGEPMVVITIDGHRAEHRQDAPDAATPSRPNEKDKAHTPQAGRPNAASVAGPGLGTVTIIDGTSGKRTEVALTSPQGDARPLPMGDTRLLEKTRHGYIPRIGPDGTRPSAAYAQPVSPAQDAAGAPRIAVVLAGLGISASATAEALARLPGPVTFAYVPYANDLDRLTGRAREQGHEVLLQLPMEPFDYPDNDPGPQTLLTSLAPEQNIDRMHWLMSRAQGYVGLANYMGARFTANEAAFAPILREVAKRGLLYFDDGTSARSLAGQIAGANNLPFIKADIVLDAVATPAEIDRALARLEALARKNGVAIAVARALPASIERIAQWARDVETRGFSLVPLTAVAAKSSAG